MIDAMIWLIPLIGLAAFLAGLTMCVNLVICAWEYYRERREQDVHRKIYPGSGGRAES